MIAPQPFFRARGTPFSVLHRIRALVLLGHSVDLVTYPFGEPVPLDGLNIIRSPKPPLINDVKIGPSIGKLILDIPLYFTARKQLKLKSYDVIHSHEEAAFFAVALARKHCIKHVYDMHSSLPQQLANFGKFNVAPVRHAFEKLERYVLDTCDGVITICGDLADTVNSLGVGVPHAMIENTADDMNVFAPREYQGLDLLLDAFKIVAKKRPDAHLLMVGGRQEQVTAMKDRAEKLGISRAISFSGTIPSSEIPSYLKAADVIASPRSSGTNTPLKIYGYMKSGVPMVATNKYTHTQTLDESTALLVAANPHDFAQGILTLLEDRDCAMRLAESAKQKAAKEYSDSAYLDRVGRFYDLIIESTSAPAASMPSVNDKLRSQE
jgi:glycosyltransferase involved in cell wall biosynthesis